MNDKQPSHPNCRVCRSADTIYLCRTPNERGNTRILHHYRCAQCGCVFIGNNVDAEDLSLAYSTLDSAKYYKETERPNRSKMAGAVARLKELVPTSGSIIDIGTGSGLFVEMLREAGFSNVSAHEIPGADLSGLKGTASHIYQDFDYSTIPTAGFDAVTMLDVLEHVIDPGYLIDNCSRILAADGTIYFHTPVVTRTDRMMHSFQKLPVLKKIGRMWQRGRSSIFHLENYTPKALTSLLQRSGFGDIRIEVTNELSWPVTRYIRNYLLAKQGLPTFLAPLFYPLLYPILATNWFNANKAIVSARRLQDAA